MDETSNGAEGVIVGLVQESMSLPQLAEEILHPGSGIPGLIKALTEEGVIRIPFLIPYSTLQKLPYSYDAAVLKFQVSLGVAYLVLSVIKDGVEIIHQTSKFDQMLGISKQDTSNFTGGQHPEKNISENK